MVRFTCLLAISLFSLSLTGQTTNLADAASLPEGTHTFNFGAGDFEASVNDDGWILWMQYHHAGGTNPNLNAIPAGSDLPVYDNSPLGTDLSGDPSRWGHGAQAFAASIPDGDLWLRWEATTSNHNRKIHFESPVLGRWQFDGNDRFTPDIISQNILLADHTANLPASAKFTAAGNAGNNALTSGPFIRFNVNTWALRSAGNRWNVDDQRNDDGSLIGFEHSTIHRVWVKTIPPATGLLIALLDELQDHINGVALLTDTELDQIKNQLFIYADRFGDDEANFVKAMNVIADYDAQFGPLFVNPATRNGVFRDASGSPHLNVHRAMIALQQAVFDYSFTPETYATSPELINGISYNSVAAFPGAVDPPADPSVSYTTSIRANFIPPAGVNPSYGINGDGTEHAYRPTGTYLAPGSVATVTVPESFVGQDYYVRVGAHEWDLSNKPQNKRLDRITKRFSIDATTIEVFNPLGGAVAILVPRGANQGIVDVTVSNVVEAPFYSLKSFYTTPDFDAELSKPAPWAVFETDNMMYTVPTHSIVPGQHDLEQGMRDWDVSMRTINDILGRPLVSDKHDVYVISDLMIRGGAFSIGYPMSNHAINYNQVPGATNFIDGPGRKYDVTFHEYGHAMRISKFPGEVEAMVNFPYVMAMNEGLGQPLDEAVVFSFGDDGFTLDLTGIHRMVSNSFGGQRDISNSTTNEVRYQHRGYGHYNEIVNVLGWCPLENFWEQENIDFQNGIDRGVNGQDSDSRIMRMSKAAGEDLRPLFDVYGILTQDVTAMQTYMTDNGLLPSPEFYDRLQEYRDLLPLDNDAFVDYALEVYPNFMTSGPNLNPDFGAGWHYQKSLTYDAAEGQQRLGLLQGIIDRYYPDGRPDDLEAETVCCTPYTMVVRQVNGVPVVDGGVEPYSITITNVGDEQTVTVVDGAGCQAVVTYPFDGTLPVSFAEFTAHRNDKFSLLNWTTASEENNRGFEVQHGTDGVNFRRIGFVDGQNVPEDYTFEHRNPLNGDNFYRLAQEDFDGQRSLSEIRLVSFTDVAPQLTVTPNPARDQLTVGGVVVTAQSVLSLLDVNGRLVARVTGLATLNVTEVPPGSYVVRWEDGATTYHRKVVVRR